MSPIIGSPLHVQNCNTNLPFCHVIQMRFRIISKIAVALSIVLVIVVLLEFTLLNLYVKETDVNFPKGESNVDGVVNLVTKDPRNITATSSRKETGVEWDKAKMYETKR